MIKQLICNFKLDFAPIEKQYNIDFKKHFAEDLQLLQPLLEDGLISETETGLQVSPKGRLLIRNICLCFDTYSRAAAKRQQFSRLFSHTKTVKTYISTVFIYFAMLSNAHNSLRLSLRRIK